MADISVEQKTGGQNTWIWALVAIASVAALMFWLASQSAEIERMAAIQEETAAAEAAADEQFRGETVQLAALAQNPEGFAGRDLVVDAASVAALLGPRAFWADVPGANPYLVVLGQSVEAVEMPVVGQTLRVQGRVLPVDTATIADLVQGGSIAEGSAEEATFATHYLLVDAARVTEQAAAAAAPAAAPADTAAPATEPQPAQ